MIYILSQDYPSLDNKYAMSYVHSRNKVYVEQGLEITVVSMSTRVSYSYEGIKVIAKRNFVDLIEKNDLTMDDIIISHAPNVKNHVPLINKAYSKVRKVIFFFHGHEVLKTTKYYPKEFDFKKQSKVKLLIHLCYDLFKLRVLNKMFQKINQVNKLKIVCVSNWMKEHAALCLKINLDDFDTSVINNNANNNFLEHHYELSKPILADFVTIRPLDNSKYAIDLVVKLAENNPQYKFHVYGKGEYFKFNVKPSNLEVMNDFIHPKDLPALLNKYRCGLMPTRLDAQGVMVCEMATYGIPVITSNLNVCKEMFSEFENVYLVEDSFFDTKLESDIIKTFAKTECKSEKFNLENTVQKEIEILKALKIY